MAQDPSIKKPEESTEKIKVHTIPQAFYGAADPFVRYASQDVKTEKKESPKPSGIKPPAPKLPPTKPGVPATKSSAPPAPQAAGKRWPIILIFGVIILIGIAGISWYFLRDLLPTEPEIVEPVVVPTPASEPINVPAIIPTTTIDIPTTTPEPDLPDSLSGAPLEFSRLLFLNTIDLDADELTDMEEEVFGTDPGIWDSDDDGYFDGQEISNLYNPIGFAPVRLADSGLVKEYVNPSWRYRLYYPTVWELAAVDLNADQVLISAATGDYIEVRAIRKGRQESFRSWFARIVPDQLFTDLISFTTTAKENVFKRRDDLTAYFVQEDVVYVIIYHSPSQDAVPFRHIMQMIVSGFRPNKALEISTQTETSVTSTTSPDQTTTSTIATTSTLPL